MAMQLVLFVLSLLVVSASASTDPIFDANTLAVPFNRSVFPADFVFGASSAAYQYEGAAFEGGKGQSIWDNFAHTYPEKIMDRSNGDVADNFYHLYKEDVKIMKYVGLDAFRFSISWPRVLPTGKLSAGKNQEGINFYNNLINELIENGIQPFVTIFHWDVPLALEQEYEGWLSPRVKDDYLDFVELCFKEFGDRVKHWITMNEPYIFISGGYDTGSTAPGRCSAWRNFNCPGGNSGTEPYIIGHNMLLAHASAVKLYKQRYQAKQKGKIGITLVSHWMVPYSTSRVDKKAAERALEFMYGWFIHPIIYGDYPRIMQTLVGKRLPKFSVEEANMVKGSFDFLGVNYYTSNYAALAHFANDNNISSGTDNHANLTTFKNGIPIGDPTGVSTFFVYPKGLRDLLAYTKTKYNNPPIYVTENGMGDYNNMTAREGVKDTQRVGFYQGHLRAVHEVIEMGGNVKGFFAWSFLDTFEWNSGYTLRFGLCFVDYKDGLKRYPKNSALWYKKFLLKKLKNLIQGTKCSSPSVCIFSSLSRYHSINKENYNSLVASLSD